MQFVFEPKQILIIIGLIHNCPMTQPLRFHPPPPTRFPVQLLPSVFDQSRQQTTVAITQYPPPFTSQESGKKKGSENLVARRVSQPQEKYAYDKTIGEARRGATRITATNQSTGALTDKQTMVPIPFPSWAKNGGRFGDTTGRTGIARRE